MQVKVFEAEDMASGLRQVRRELGPDALILSTRTIKNGRMGRLGKQHLEITAAIDSKWPEEKTTRPDAATTRPDAARSRASKVYQQNHTDTSPPLPQPSSPVPADPPANAESPQPPAGSSMDSSSRRELDELKDMVKTLAGEISRIGSQPQVRQAEAPPRAHSLEKKLRANRPSTPIEDILLSKDIDNNTVKILANFAGEKLEEADLLDDRKIYSFLHDTLEDILTVNTPDFRSMSAQKRMALIGPTGVGKTTTLAKIAAKYLAEKSNSIAFITVDTYRIAAVEQLKVYGEIMHLPVEVVITPQQLVEALDKHRDKELILIDTAGRSPQDSLGIEEIQSYFTPELDIENYLVLSATTRDNELIKIFAQFEQVPVHGTIFTKIDECTTLGVLLNMQVHAGKPLSYLTNGQRVPEDILEADKKQVAHLILPYAGGIVHE